MHSTILYVAWSVPITLVTVILWIAWLSKSEERLEVALAKENLRQRQLEELSIKSQAGMADWHPVDPFQMDRWLGLNDPIPEQSSSASHSETVPGIIITEPTGATGKWTLTSGGRMAGWNTPRILTMRAKPNKMPSRTEVGSHEDGSLGPAPGSWASTRE